MRLHVGAVRREFESARAFEFTDCAIHLETIGFELDHEITSKVLSRGRIRGLRTFWRYRRG